ncbi:uncharacterized protein LOC144107365 [Amblyomma americanum]
MAYTAGPVLRISTMNHLPHAQFLPNGSIPHITFATGLLKLLWDSAERLGIRHKTTILANPEWGVKMSNGSWTGFIGELQRNESDVSFTLFYPTNSRNEVAEPTSSIWAEDVVILGGFGNDTSESSSIASSLTVFEPDVWIALGVFLLLLTLIKSLAPGSSQKFISRLLENLLTLARCIFLQASACAARGSSGRVAVAFWWLAMLVFANVFTGKMKAGLTVRHRSGHRIDSAAQLASREDVRVFMLRGPAYPLLLALQRLDDPFASFDLLAPWVSSTGGLVEASEWVAGGAFWRLAELSPRMNDRLVYRKLKPGSLVPYRRLWSATVLDQVVEGKAVIVGDRTTLVYQAAKRCRRYPHHEFYIGRERLFSHPLVVYYNRRNVRLLMNAWERRRSRLTEAGVVLKWHAETVSSGGDFSRCPRVDVGERDNLDFDNLRSVFLLLLAGHGLATAVLLAEAVLATLVRCYGANAPRNGTTVQHRHHARHRKGARTTKRRPNAFLGIARQ